MSRNGADFGPIWTMSSSHGRPNVLLIVLDCVRASDFNGQDSLASGMPCCDQLRKESAVFPRATSPTPWTLPSHASLFSGVQPWESGCHWKGNLKLDSGVPRLATLLKAAGYRTLALSANPLICPTFNLLDGFDHAAWARWWEPYFRFAGPQPPPEEISDSLELKNSSSRVRSGVIDEFLRESTFLAHRYPFLLEAGSRAIHNFRSDSDDWQPVTSRWIEPTLERWVRDTPMTQPVFAFVNLLDAHEPYFFDSSVAPGIRGALQYLRARQDNIRYDAGQLDLRPSILEFLHRLYLRMIRLMDSRIDRLVSTLRETDRWDDTLVILTSDHGQAFGEHGILYHMVRVDEQLIRVPLWVRFPEGRFKGTSAKGWASLVDVVPTVLDNVGGISTGPLSGVSLERLIDSGRPGPLAAVSDGVPWGHNRSKFPARRLADLDRIRVAVYEGDSKVVVEGADESEIASFDVSRDPGEKENLFEKSQREFRVLRTEAERVRLRMTESPRVDLPSEAEERLKSWGYL